MDRKQSEAHRSRTTGLEPLPGPEGSTISRKPKIVDTLGELLAYIGELEDAIERLRIAAGEVAPPEGYVGVPMATALALMGDVLLLTPALGRNLS